MDGYIWLRSSCSRLKDVLNSGRKMRMVLTREIERFREYMSIMEVVVIENDIF